MVLPQHLKGPMLQPPPLRGRESHKFNRPYVAKEFLHSPNVPRTMVASQPPRRFLKQSFPTGQFAIGLKHHCQCLTKIFSRLIERGALTIYPWYHSPDF
jgi:hypothetical protein